MGRLQYCVYNQTSECFLSLGVTFRESTLAHWKGILSRREQRYDEGNWLVRPKSIHLFRFFSARDLVFLDEGHRVIQAMESFPPMQFAPVAAEVTSVLALPLHTIYASQTQPGNQLVICVPEEMEFRLRRIPDVVRNHSADSPLQDDAIPAHDADPVLEERRVARRKRWPRLVAYDSTGGALEVHGLKDLTADGLYLMTEERWPLGTLVTMTLQRTDCLDDLSQQNSIVAQLRVSRWGDDGVGLAFTPSDVEDPHLMPAAAR